MITQVNSGVLTLRKHCWHVPALCGSKYYTMSDKCASCGCNTKKTKCTYENSRMLSIEKHAWHIKHLRKLCNEVVCDKSIVCRKCMFSLNRMNRLKDTPLPFLRQMLLFNVVFCLYEPCTTKWNYIHVCSALTNNRSKDWKVKDPYLPIAWVHDRIYFLTFSDYLNFKILLMIYLTIYTVYFDTSALVFHFVCVDN